MSQPAYNPPLGPRPVPGVKECCLDPDNLDREYIAEDKVIDTCRVCKCRHRRMHAETANLSAAMQAALTGKSVTMAAPVRYLDDGRTLVAGSGI